MKIVCVEECNYPGWFFITKGKTYYVIEETELIYHISDDRNIIGHFPKSYFKKLTEIRNELIDELLK